MPRFCLKQKGKNKNEIVKPHKDQPVVESGNGMKSELTKFYSIIDCLQFV